MSRFTGQQLSAAAATSAVQPVTEPSSVRSLPRHLPALDGLRGVAILMVMLFHFTLTGGENALLASGLPFKVALLKLLLGGWMGVDLFFVLSGFLITGILLDTESSPHRIRNFFARRALRIFPLNFGVLLLCFCILPPLGLAASVGANEQLWFWLFAVNWTMKQHQLGLMAAEHLGHFWSLAVEEQFYLGWPLFILYAPREKLGRVIVTCAGIAIGLRLLLLVVGEGGRNYFLTPTRMDALALGGYVALIARRPGGLAILRRLAVWLLPVLTLVAAISLFQPRSMVLPPLLEIWRFSLLAGLFASVVVVAVTADPRGGVGRLLSHPILRFFGKYSYGLYVWHFLLEDTVARWLPLDELAARCGSPLAAVGLYFSANIAVSTTAAYGSFHLYEKHFLRLKRFFATDRASTSERTEVAVLGFAMPAN